MMDTVNTNQVMKSIEGIENLDTLFIDVLLGSLPKRVKKRFRKFSTQEQAQMVYDRLKGDATNISFDLPEIDVGMVGRVLDLLQINTKVALNYPLRPYPGEITYFIATDEKRETPIQAGWAELALEGFNEIEVSGDHYGMLIQPNVSELAKQIQSQIKLSKRK